MFAFTPAQRAFLYLSLHAKLHQHLDGMNRHNRDMLVRTDDDATTFATAPIDPSEAAAMREELLKIRFSEND